MCVVYIVYVHTSMIFSSGFNNVGPSTDRLNFQSLLLLLLLFIIVIAVILLLF